MTALRHSVGTRLTPDDLEYLDRCVVADAAALAPHGIKVSRSTVLASCLRARQIREAGLDTPERIAAFNAATASPPHDERATRASNAGRKWHDIACHICGVPVGESCEQGYGAAPKAKRGKGSGS